MKNSMKYTAGPLLGALMLTVVLAGCAGTGQTTDPATAPAVTATPTPVVASEPAAPAPAAAGDVLPEKPQDLAEGLSAYKGADGNYVVLDTAAPLPEPVLAQVHDELAAVPVESSSAATLARLQRETGKQIILVAQKFVALETDVEGHLYWVVAHSPTAVAPPTTDKAAAISAAEAYAAAQPDAANWIVIVVD